MKNFFKRPTKKKESNMLIEYTRWLFKVILSTIIFLGICFALFAWYMDQKDEYFQDMLFLKCKSIEDNRRQLILESTHSSVKEYKDIVNNDQEAYAMSKKPYFYKIVGKTIDGKIKPSYIEYLHKEKINEEKRSFYADSYFHNYSDIEKFAKRYELESNDDLYFMNPYNSSQLLDIKLNTKADGELYWLQTLNRKTLEINTYNLGRSDIVGTKLECSEISSFRYKYHERKMLKDYFKDIKI